MAESLSEVSGSLEVLEASEDGKKKSKFKAFKNFFGKKKKKESEDAQGGRRLKSSLSSSSINISSLEPVREGQRTEPRIKSNMGSKSLSHDSIFMLEPEPERSTHQLCPSPEPKRGRPLQRSQVSRTLPRTGTSNVHGAVSGLMFGAMPQYVPKSGIWVGGSKVPEIPTRCPCQPSISPPLIQSDTNSNDFEISSVDEESPKSSRRKALPHNILTLKKSSFEPSPGPIRSQSLTTFAMIASPGSTHLPMSFNTPATTKGCLDSSAARHKMALNPRKQKKKKNPQTSAKPKQEESMLLLVSEEEKSTTKPKEADRKKPKKDNPGTGVSGLEQSKKTETYDKKTVDQAASADAAGSQSYPFSAAHGRRGAKKGSSASGTSECVPRGRSFKQSSRGLRSSDRAGSPPADQSARDHLLWNLSLEQQVLEQPTTPQAESPTPQELLSGKDATRKRGAGVDLKVRKGLASPITPEDSAESSVSDPSPCPEAQKPAARASVSTTQEDVIFSVAMEAQVFMDPSHIQSEREEAFSFDLQAIKFKMESVQDIPAVCREKSPGSILRAVTASISGPTSTQAEGAVSAERLPPRSLSWVLADLEAEEPSSGSESSSVEASGSELQLLPGRSFQSLAKPRDDDQKFFTESASSAVELSRPEQPLAPRYSSLILTMPKVQEASSDSDSPSEGESDSERHLALRHPLQSLGMPEDYLQVFSVSKSSGDSRASEEELTPRCASRALGETEAWASSTKSNSYVAKYNSADDWSTSEEDMRPRPPAQASGKPTDVLEIPSGSKSAPEDWGVSVEGLAQSFSRPKLQQQVSSETAAAAAATRAPRAPGSSLVEPAPAGKVVPSWLRPQAEHQAPGGRESPAEDCSISLEPLPPRVSSRPMGQPRIQQPVAKGPEISTAVGGRAAELPPPKQPSQPPLKPQPAVPERPEHPVVEGSVSVEVVPPRGPFRALARPAVVEQVFLSVQSAPVEENVVVEPLPLPKVLVQPLVHPKVEPDVFSGLEGAATEKVIAMEPPLPEHSAPPSLPNPEAQQESDNASEGASVELPSGFPAQPSMRSKLQPQLPPLDTVGASAACSQPAGPASPRSVLQSWQSSPFEQQSSARLESAALEWGISLEPLPPRRPSQTRKRRAAARAASRESRSLAARERSSPVEPKPPRGASLTPGSTKVKQPSWAVPEGSMAQKGGSMEQLPSRMSSQTLTKSVSKQQVSWAVPESSVAQKGSSMEQLPPRMSSQTLTKSVSKQQMSWAIAEGSMEQLSSRMSSQTLTKSVSKQQVSWAVPESSVAQKGGSMEQLPPRMSSQSLTKSVSKQQPSWAVPEGSMAQKGSSMEQLPPRMSSQSLTKSVSKQQPSWAAPEGSMAQRSGSTEQPPPRMSSQPATKPVAKQPASAAPEGSVAQRSSSTEQPPPRMSSQPPTKPVGKQPASAAPEGSMAQRSSSTEQPPLRMSSQPLTKPLGKQLAPAALKSAATEGVASTERGPSKQPSQPPTRYKVQQMSSTFENAAQVAISGKLVPFKQAPQPLGRSKVQELSSRLEITAAEGGKSKKAPVSRQPSQSFVKFMAEQVFSERPTAEGRSPRNPPPANQPSKPLLRSKDQYQAFSELENASTKGDTSSKLLPMPPCPIQPSGKPEGPKEVLSHPESAPLKWGHSKDQLPPGHLSQALGKLEYQQGISFSVSQSSHEERKSSQGQLPFRGPPQAKEGAKLQPQLFSTGPVSVPVKRSRSEEPQPPRNPHQAFAGPEYQPQGRSGPVWAASTEGTISEGGSDSWSQPKGPASPNKAKKHKQGSEDPIKNILTFATKPVKFTTAPAKQAPTLGGTVSKEEGLEGRNQNNSHPNVSTTRASVENLFGVRLRKVPSLKKYKKEKQDDLTKLSSFFLGPVSSSAGKEQRIRSASQGLLGTAEYLTYPFDVAEKQQSRPKSECFIKKQPAYKVPGKAPGRQADYGTFEPAWITMVKQRQKSSQVYVPKKEAKTKNKAGARAEAKEPRGGAGLANENQPRKIFTSVVNKQEKMAQKKLSIKSIKAGFEDPKIVQVPAVEKETRRSSTLPAVLQEPAQPDEPVWFSLAKKKAKAWSHIAEIMQ
uniref:acrosomal protein KIAA1210 homolog n=1 Tax=Nyctereutes procyonoides TaxID=34880 RepID=UPI0024440648|nr:acrosomal protein KIAA1210 homolog [Nyctereutes procyonoides]